MNNNYQKSTANIILKDEILGNITLKPKTSLPLSPPTSIQPANGDPRTSRQKV